MTKAPNEQAARSMVTHRRRWSNLNLTFDVDISSTPNPYPLEAVMTMPNERTRALRWGRKLLERLAGEQALDPAIRQQAQRILLAYPMPGQIEKLVTDGAPVLPAEASISIQQARLLLLRLDREDGCSDAVLYDRQCTMRHFPDTQAIELWSRPIPGHDLSDWLWLEGTYK